MEHKKNGVENMKVWFGDFLDEVNLSNSEMLRKVDELEGRVTLLQEEITLYKNKVRELERQMDAWEQRAAIQPEVVAKIPTDSAGSPAGDSAGSLDGSSDGEPVTVEEREKEYGGDKSDEPEADHDPGFSLEEEEIIPAVEEQPVSEPVRAFEPKTEPVPQSVGKEVKSGDASAGDLFSQPEVQLEPSVKAGHPEPEKVLEPRIILEAARPDWYDWEVDYPAPYIGNIAEGIGFNDRILFLKELFEGDEQLFKRTVMRLNEMETFKEAMEYLQAEFPRWNNLSDEVYRFYMNVRRKLRK